MEASKEQLTAPQLLSISAAAKYAKLAAAALDCATVKIEPPERAFIRDLAVRQHGIANAIDRWNEKHD